MKTNLILGRMTFAMAAAALGITIMKIALPTLAGVWGLSISEIGLITASAAFAWPVFGLLAGWSLDRFGRACAFRLGLAFAASVAVVLFMRFNAGDPSVVLLCLCALFIGLAEVLTETAGQTILPDLVDKSDLDKGNSWLQGGKTVAAMLLAPLLLATALGFQPARAFGFALALMLAAFIALPRPVRQVESLNTGLKGFFGGLLILSRQGTHRRFTILLTAMAVSWGAWMTLIVPYALSPDHLNLDARGVGKVMTALGCGSLTGAVSYSYLKRRLGKRGTLAIDPLASAAFLIVPALGLGLIPVFASAFLAGVGGVTWAIFVSAYQQATIPPVMLGRSVAAYRWIGWTGFFAGSALAGIVADTYGLRMAFMIFALPAVAATAIFYWSNPLSKAKDGSELGII